MKYKLTDDKKKKLAEYMKQVRNRDENNTHLNCAIIDCNISIIDFGKIVRFKRFSCFSYSENSGGLGGLLFDKVNEFMFHFSATQNHILIYPIHNKEYKPMGFVDFYEHIINKIDERARLFMWGDYQETKKREDKEYQKYLASKEYKNDLEINKK